MKSLSHQFLDFCRSKPADEEYDYLRSSVCAFYQFAVANGIPDPVRSSYSYGLFNGPEIPAALNGAIRVRPWTYGALASRLEAELVK